MLCGNRFLYLCTLFGTLGQSDEYEVSERIRGNAFERNQTDKLTLELPQSMATCIKRNCGVTADGAVPAGIWIILKCGARKIMRRQHIFPAESGLKTVK